MDIKWFYSCFKPFSISVIQGRILDPILFLISFNDLYSASDLLKIMFTDDTACLASNAKLNEHVQFVNREIKKIAGWFIANKMAVNVSKTKFIIFHTKSVPARQPSWAVAFLHSLSALRKWEGTLSVILANRRWGPTYTAVHEQYLEPWADFSELLQLLIWWRGQQILFLAKEASGAAFCNLPPSTLGLQHRLRPRPWDTAVAQGGGRSFYSCIIP